MTDPSRAGPRADAPAGPRAEPPSGEVASALPIDVHEGVDTLVVTAEHTVPGRPVPGLVDDALPRTVLRMALPAVAGMLLMTVFGSVDAYWIGTRIGSQALAAVTISLFWIWLLIAVAEMVSVGLIATAARRHGEGRPDEAARLAGDALRFALLLGALVAVGGLLYIDRLFALMDAPPAVAALGRSYLGIYLLGAPLIFGFFAVDAAFRAAGDTRTPFRLLAASVALTLVLDPLLILGPGPFPALGVAGASIATVSIRAVAFLIGVVLLSRRGMLRFERVRSRNIATIVRIGLPTAATGVMFSLIYVAITRVTTPFGATALAALGIGHRIESWLYVVGVGFGVAAAAVVGQSIGAGRLDRAERAGWIATGYASIPGVIACVAELLFAEGLTGIFTDDPQLIAEGARYLRIAAVSQLVISAEIVLEGALGGAGDTLPTMVASTSLTALRVPLTVWAAARWGTTGIWAIISITAFLRGLAMMALWRSGRWKRKSF